MGCRDYSVVSNASDRRRSWFLPLLYWRTQLVVAFSDLSQLATESVHSLDGGFGWHRSRLDASPQL